MTELMSKERPIIMSEQSVRAILEGRKTQTRRVIKPQPRLEDEWNEVTGAAWSVWWKNWEESFENVYEELPSFCPYGKVGDRLWVRESYRIIEVGKGPSVRYMADCDYSEIARAKWKTPMFMPKALSRIMLEIVDIRVERLQDITERDARAEGLAPKFRAIYPTGPWQLETAVDQYKGVWNEINAKHGTDWDTNPWVWVLEFKVVKEDVQ